MMKTAIQTGNDERKELKNKLGNLNQLIDMAKDPQYAGVIEAISSNLIKDDRYRLA